ncbi:unnamed protein product, partial [Ectocarpus sp. 12 AP-2014]
QRQRPVPHVAADATQVHHLPGRSSLVASAGDGGACRHRPTREKRSAFSFAGTAAVGNRRIIAVGTQATAAARSVSCCCCCCCCCYGSGGGGVPSVRGGGLHEGARGYVRRASAIAGSVLPGVALCAS